MRESPRLAETAITEALQTHYGLQATDLAFLPVGNDSASSAYCVETTDGATYYLKARARSGFSLASLIVPHYLHRQGMPHIIPPLITASRGLSVSVEGFALSLYPFVHGRMGAHGGLSETQWQELGALVRRLHSTHLPPEIAVIVPRETYTPSRHSLMEDLEAAVCWSELTGAQQRLSEFWHSRQETIGEVVDRCDALARHQRQAAGPLVLCHADLHPWNTLIDTSDRLWLVDWDEVILALKERDLMFVVGGIGTQTGRPQDTAHFLEGYGNAVIDPDALAYYRYAWAVQDMAAYAERVFFLPDLSEEARCEAVRGFVDLFEPGEIISLALDSEGASVP
jgi:spectinomycin phosphotransferase